MPQTKATTELTVEEQIAQIQKEAQDKIKELRSKLSWDQRFKTAFNTYVKSKSGVIAEYLHGHKLESYEVNQINEYLREANLNLVYNSATFDNSLYYNQSAINNLVDEYDLSEYPVYTVFAVLENAKVVGYIQVNCNYSSYNGNEYSSWTFVQPKEITCIVFTAYKP